MNKTFAVATLAAVAAAWGEDLGHHGLSRGYDADLSYAQSGHGRVGYGRVGYGGRSVQGGYDVNTVLGRQHGHHTQQQKMDLGDHEYGNDDHELGNDDREYGNDDREYGTNGGALGGEHAASNRLIRVGGVANKMNGLVHVSKARADMDRSSDHEGHRGHIGYNRRIAHEHGREFGDRDGSQYGNTDTIDLTAENDDHGEPHHDDHDDRESNHDDEARHIGVWDHDIEQYGRRVQGSAGVRGYGRGYGQLGRHHERGISGHGKGYSQMHGEGPSADVRGYDRGYQGDADLGVSYRQGYGIAHGSGYGGSYDGAGQDHALDIEEGRGYGRGYGYGRDLGYGRGYGYGDDLGYGRGYGYGRDLGYAERSYGNGYDSRSYGAR